MKNTIHKMIKILLYIRALINRFLFPANSYYKATKTLKPASTKFGFDRGTPIDRFWIEDFLENNKKHIKGTVLEITDPAYTKKYGGKKVKRSDVLDIDSSNKKANINGDLRNLKAIIKDNTYDCVILTHVLGLIDDYASAIIEIKRILKPNGVLLYTGSCLGPILGEKVYWRFTPNSVKYIFETHFKPSRLKIETYGNVLTGQAFWVGMAQEDLTKYELGYNDPRFPCAVSAIVKK
jgi:SAM-dependent methyltransferase